MTIKLTDFGHKTLNGLQHKDIADVQGQDKFIKLDRLNPIHRSNWKPQFDFMYSSVSESIASCVARNIQTTTRYADYVFETFDDNGEIVSGTSSSLYLKPGEVEHVLSIDNNGVSETNVAMPIDAYIDLVETNQETRFHNLIRAFEEYRVPQDVAKDFILEQATFDVLVGNQDRLHNPSNFVFGYDKDTQTATPIVMDYGRCLQMNAWSETYEKALQMDDPELQNDIHNFATNILNRNDAVISGHDFQSHVDTLKQYGAKPLLVDVQQVLLDLDTLSKKFEGQPFEKFAKVKCDTMKEIMARAQECGLIEDARLMLTNEDLEISEVNRMTIQTNGHNVAFLLSGDVVLGLEVKGRTVSVTETGDEFAADIILPVGKRTYAGLEKQLQHYMDSDKKLPELLQQIQKDGFSTPIHYYLDVDVTPALEQ